MSNEKLTLSVKECAEMMGVSLPIMYEIIKRDGFPSIRISERRIIIPVEPLRKWLNENAENGASA